MTNIKLSIAVLIVLISVSACSLKNEKQIEVISNDKIADFERTGAVSIKNLVYLIDNGPVELNNGFAETVINKSQSKTITRYFGNEAYGDLNNDGKDDVAFLLTQETGGSGIFYYIATALNSNTGYQGLNTIFLGDRIAPQTTEIRDSQIIVNYADRNIGESFAEQASLGVSKYFKIQDNKLVEVAK